MALAVSVRFAFIDGKGKTSFTKIHVPTGFAISDYVEFAQGFAQLLADATTGRITGVTINLGLDVSGIGLNTVASGLSDVGQKALFIFRSAVAGFRRKFFLPTLSETKVVAGSDTIDTNDADVAAFQTAIEDGIVVTGGTIAPVDKRGNDLTALDSSREIFRKRR